MIIINEIKNNKTNYKKNTINNNPLYIFDETDTLINPLKSNLNIPIEKIMHPEFQIIINELILFSKNLTYEYIN